MNIDDIKRRQENVLKDCFDGAAPSREELNEVGILLCYDIPALIEAVENEDRD